MIYTLQADWHRKFAWFPVEVARDPDTGAKTFAWLQFVERRRIIKYSWEWVEYRLIGGGK